MVAIKEQLRKVWVPVIYPRGPKRTSGYTTGNEAALGGS